MANPTVILITGVSQGIGKRMAEICLGRPNHIVIGSVRDDTKPAVTGLKEITPAEGSKLLLVHIENTSLEDPGKAAAAVEAAGIDHVDTIIACAGASPFPVMPIETVTNEHLIWAYQTNAAGPLGLFQAFQHLLRKSQAPRWASISSAGGSISLIGPMQSYITIAYSMSKAAQNFMTQSLAHSQQDWLTVIDINPGHSRTEPGNWIARRIGMEQAPLTIDQSATAVLRTVETTTREAALGKLIHAIDGSVVPW